MKRCPKCEFIYEDDQSLCDMDGILLVLDSRTLPNHHALQTVPAAKTPPPKRNRAVPAFATLILALVLGLVYYVSIQRRHAQNSYTPPPPSAASTSNPVPEVNPTPEAQPSAEEPKPEPPKPLAAAAAPAPLKKTAPKPTPTPAKAKVEKKDDSKVGNILKKTGRILKKPFKF
jgi:cytoskeletal protein RodZ